MLRKQMRRAGGMISILPATFDNVPHSFRIFAAIVLIEVRCLDVSRRGGVRVIEQTVSIYQ